MARAISIARLGRLWKVSCAAALLVVFMAPVAYAQKKDKKKKAEVVQPQAPAKPKVDPSKLVWPSPPDVARIKWIAEVSGQDDLTPPVPKKKKKASWMDRLAGISLPDEVVAKSAALAKPFGVAADSKGRIYAADTGKNQVYIFDLNKKLVEALPGNFVMPIAVVVDDADRIFVVDSKQRQVIVFSPSRELEATFGADKLERPVGAAIDNENRFLYVVDAKASRLAVFDADKFTFLRYLGQPSDPLDPQTGTFSTPLSAAVDDDGNVFVTDTLNDRVQMFDADGNFIQMFGKQGATAGTFMRAKGIALDSDGHIYVTDAEFSNVQVFDREGRTLGVFGSRGTEPGQFTLITGIFIDRKNNVYVADQWRARVQVFRYVTDAEAAAQQPGVASPVSPAAQVTKNPAPPD